MADDPGDYVPVKEAAVRSLHPQPGPRVLELSVEDRYLKVRQENDQLKLRLQKQDNKMKRLATKLMRLMSEQKQQLDTPEARRALELQATVAEQGELMDQLRAANTMLQKRVDVMKRQLVEQGRLRASLPRYRRTSPSRDRPLPAQAVKQADALEGGEGVDAERLQAHILQLEQEKASLSQRLEEGELRERRRQVAENVELIRLRRSLAQQAAQLAALEERAHATERDLVQARHSLSTAHRDAEGAQQQRSVLKNRVLELEAEVQSLQSEHWRCLEMEVALQDLQMERDAVQGQNARLLEMVEERGRDRSAHMTHLEERLMDEACQKAQLTDRLHAAQQQLSEVKARAAEASHGDHGGAGIDHSLLDQVGRLETDLTREMQERVRLIQLLEGLHVQRDSRSRAVHQDGGLASSASGERQPEESCSRPPPGEPPPITAAIVVPACCSVGCMTDRHLSMGSGLDKSVQVALDEGEACQPPRVPSLEQSKKAVMSRTTLARPSVPRVPTLLESAGLPDESEATDADVSLGRDKSQGEVSSDSALVNIPCQVEKSQGEVSGDSAEGRKPCLVEQSQGEESSTVDDSPGVDRLSMANHLETMLELDKCRDLLRVQCRINSSLQDEVTLLKQRLGQAEATQTRRLAELRRQLEGRAVAAGEVSPGALGLLEVHAGTLRLDPGALGDVKGRNVFLSWVLWDKEVTCTPPRPASATVQYEYSAVYQVNLGTSFLDYLRNAQCVVELHVLDKNGGSQLRAQGSLRLAELLVFPGRRLHASTPLLPLDAYEPLGTLHCWFRLAQFGPAAAAPHALRPTLEGTTPPAPAPAPRAAPTPAPRSMVQPPGLERSANDSEALSEEGASDKEESAARMKRLADSVLGQFLEQKWQERKMSAGSLGASSPATTADLTLADEDNVQVQ